MSWRQRRQRAGHARGLVDPEDLPDDKHRVLKRAQRLEAWSLAYLASAIVVIYLTLGASQAMKAAWLEDLLSLIPPISFLVGSRVAHRKPSTEYPYGYHRAVTVAYLVGSVALLFMGTWLFVESVLKLVRAEYPSIGTTQLFGHTVWMGWLMLAALLWSAIPSVLLGRAKLPLAESLHDKVLHADALMNKADWLTAVAAMLGVLGIGMGWWWADAVAAGGIALDIAWDGQRHLRTALGDLMDRTPRTLDSKHAEPLPRRIHEALCGLDWVEAAQVRVREDGHVFCADVRLVPKERGPELVTRLGNAAENLKRLDWRLRDVLLVPVDRLG
ncbi:cation transporter [Myxococcus xanthus]|uniref:cation diffusion facilitator family transporter n=1 Tax=Myxococcus xanthus TaxID=34 RepID=UPI0019170AB5|nr:cation diffusion facilitator family transporter [Myxococcus xanthus]QQR42783.1 cation transporter [Myxococcus xanthus]